MLQDTQVYKNTWGNSNNVIEADYLMIIFFVTMISLSITLII